MNVYYKIIELSRLLTELQNKGTNAKPFISPELAIGLILMVVIIMATSAAFASNSFDDILSIAITTVLVIVVVPLVINIIFKQAYSTEITPAENKSKQEAYKKQIVELYNSNKDLFDNRQILTTS